MKTFQGSTPRHYSSRVKLVDKLHSIARLENPHLELGYLEDIGILASEFSLEEPETYPLHFFPASKTKLRSFEDKRPEIEDPPSPGGFGEFCEGCRPAVQCCHARDVSEMLRWQLFESKKREGDSDGQEEKPCLLALTKWKFRANRYRFENRLLETERQTPDDFPQQWELETMLDTVDASQPHMACISHHGVRDVSGLLRSELLIVIGMTIDRMGLESGQSHQVFPLLMVSLISTQGRIIRAHFDGTLLHVSYSRLYEFKDYDKKTIDLFLRWLMSEPVGNTKIMGTEGKVESASGVQSPRKQAMSYEWSREISMAA